MNIDLYIIKFLLFLSNDQPQTFNVNQALICTY